MNKIKEIIWNLHNGKSLSKTAKIVGKNEKIISVEVEKLVKDGILYYKTRKGTEKYYGLTLDGYLKYFFDDDDKLTISNRVERSENDAKLTNRSHRLTKSIPPIVDFQMLKNGNFILFFRFDKNLIFDMFHDKNFDKNYVIYKLIKWIKETL